MNLKDYRIGIIGGGVVGRATAQSYLGHVKEVCVYDRLPERRTHDIALVLSCDLIFVALPTPQRANSLECDISSVDNFFFELSMPWNNRNFVLKSTVPIGTTRYLRGTHDIVNLVHSPEFLTARTAALDAQMPTRNIIGVVGEPKIFKNLTTGEEKRFVPTDGCGEMLSQLYLQRWPHVPLRIMTSDESEATKLFTNGFYAVKVAYFNEVRHLADNLGLDWETVRSAVLAGGTIHPLHTQVPGPDGKRGFGGACLPKDLANLIHSQLEQGLYAHLCQAAMKRNETDRKGVSNES